MAEPAEPVDDEDEEPTLRYSSRLTAWAWEEPANSMSRYLEALVDDVEQHVRAWEQALAEARRLTRRRPWR